MLKSKEKHFPAEIQREEKKEKEIHVCPGKKYW